MKILVAVASTYGATHELAGWVTGALTDAGHSVTLRPVEQVKELESYDAVVLGSAVYIGRILTHARQFARRLESEFAPKPVWVFASGMKTITANPLQAKYTQAQSPPYFGGQYPIFGGRVDTSELGPAERALAGFMGSHGKDARDREVVTAWAAKVAEEAARASVA